MSKMVNDQYIDADEEEETCPLCIEDFDLTDKGFRPCPCGYQICQFCYNSIKNNMNGLCPACRRQYDDKQIEYKVITPEETAAYKARQAQKQKKTQAALQKEKQKAEADSLSRKHLAGLRVVQKNLVYVTGIAPKMQEDELLQTLRGEKYFGQYGKIIKIVVSKARDKHDSVGVYVTYERKEDAAGCIAAVDGTVNGDRTLRAQFGTTKYCSAYLRGDTCMNRNCMFLHEPGEAKDSYSRADLSALNAGSSQQGDARPPPPQSQQPVSAATQPMARQGSDQATSPVLSQRPALPSTASWASKPLQASRVESRSTSGTVDSPAPFPAMPAMQQEISRPQTLLPSATTHAASQPTKSRTIASLREFISRFNSDDLCFSFCESNVSEQDLHIINSYPALFDIKGGVQIRLRRQRQQEEEEARRFTQDNQTLRRLSDAELDDDDSGMRGSMQLGGEPENRQARAQGQPNDAAFDQRFAFGEGTGSPTGARDRTLTPQQHQQMLLQSMKSGGTPLGLNSQSSSTPQQSHSAPGHQRNASRFSFANDTASASANVKPVANQKLLAQQSTMMPPTTNTTQFGNQQQGSGFFTSNVQGPPPGLKSTGTPPVSGGMTFAQGHGFTTGGLPYGSGAAAGRNQNEEMMSNLLRNRASEAPTKRDEDFPPLGPTRQASISSLPPGLQSESTRRSTPTLPPGLESAIQSRHGTPTIPPGLDKPSGEEQKQTVVKDKLTDAEKTISRPSSTADLRRVVSSQIVPAVPLRVATPVRLSSRPATPVNAATVPSTVNRTHAVDASTPKGKPARMFPGEHGRELVESRTDAQTEPKTQAEADQRKLGEDTAQKQVEKDTSKRNHPGKLDISAVVPLQADQASENASQGVMSTQRVTSHFVAATSSVPPSPSTSAASPASKAGPRTVRVVQTPKTETPPPAPVLTTALATANRKLPSRQPSVASMNLPATPSSEHVSVSDNLSITSATQSRANSPPPPTSKVGSAPVRAKTKSQLKKERQERAKALEEEKSRHEDVQKSVAEDEPAQEAIVSRKKKTRKDKEIKPKTKPVKEEELPVTAVVVETLASTPDRLQQDSTPAVEDAPATPPQLHKIEASPPQTPVAYTPAQIVADLRALDSTISKSFEALFRVPVSNAKINPPITPEDLQDPTSWQLPDYNIQLGKDDVDDLLAGKPRAVSWDDGHGGLWSRTLITPGGAKLRALGEDIERRFLELEKYVQDMPEELRFRPTKPQNETQFPSFDLKALKKSFDAATMRGVSVMEQMVQDGNAMKKGAFLVDEASKYINEFVMPPATPPQTSGRVSGVTSQQQQQGHAGQTGSNNAHETGGLSLEAAERQLQEAKRAVDEREGALRRAIRKNKKLLGLG